MHELWRFLEENYQPGFAPFTEESAYDMGLYFPYPDGFTLARDVLEINSSGAAVPVYGPVMSRLNWGSQPYIYVEPRVPNPQATAQDFLNAVFEVAHYVPNATVSIVLKSFANPNSRRNIRNAQEGRPLFRERVVYYPSREALNDIQVMSTELGQFLASSSAVSGVGAIPASAMNLDFSSFEVRFSHWTESRIKLSNFAPGKRVMRVLDRSETLYLDDEYLLEQLQKTMKRQSLVPYLQEFFPPELLAAAQAYVPPHLRDIRAPVTNRKRGRGYDDDEEEPSLKRRN